MIIIQRKPDDLLSGQGNLAPPVPLPHLAVKPSARRQEAVEPFPAVRLGRFLVHGLRNDEALDLLTPGEGEGRSASPSIPTSRATRMGVRGVSAHDGITARSPSVGSAQANADLNDAGSVREVGWRRRGGDATGCWGVR
jgi:hypothetical protein